MLRGLDDIAWSGLSHAYGSAEDTPALLRKAASDHRKVASDALSELHGSIFHQGTVYEATVAAVPFLAELARHAPQIRADFTWMLGMLAHSRHAYGDEFPSVRAAVAAQVDLLLPLLNDGDHRIREAAAYTVAQAGTAAGPLWRRWEVEDDPAVRASLALALGHVDGPAAGPVLADAAVNGPPAVRVAAAVALLRAGLTWPDGTVTAVVDAIDDGATVTHRWAEAEGWYDELVVAPNNEVAADVLGHLLRAAKPDTRRAGIWAMGRRCETRRSAPAVFVPMVVPAIDDPDPHVRGEVIGALRRAGAVAGRFADMLAPVAARFPQVAGERGFTDEYRAVETLLLLADPRWIEPVCAAAAAGHQPDLSTEARFSPTVLAEIRSRLAADPARADVLAGVVAQWGTDAAAVVPDLIAAIPYAGSQVAWALLDLGHDEPAALPYLRAEAAQTGNLPAALAVWRITGDTQPLLDILRSTLSGARQAPPWEVSGLGDVGDGLLPLLPATREHLTGTAARTHPERQVQLLAARIVATADGPAAVLPTVSAVLAGGDTSAHLAATLIAELAQADPAAVASLEPQLRQQLDDRWSRIAAVRALARLGVPTAELARPLVHGIADYDGQYAVTAIVELRAVETIPALEDLVAGDRRFNTISFGDDIVWDDERLQERVRSAIADLDAMATSRWWSQPAAV